MTNEEAIGIIKNTLEKYEKYCYKNCKGEIDDSCKECKRLQAIETVLNLIQKQQEEIKHWKNGFERELEANRENICEIIKQDDLLKNKDKIISLMAERLTTPINSKEWVIDYYKRKVE